MEIKQALEEGDLGFKSKFLNLSKPVSSGLFWGTNEVAWEAFYKL